MIGILTEKPSAARNFGTALGGPQGTFNGESYKIVSARGHLFGFLMPNEQVAPELERYYKSWAASNLPWDEKQIAWKKTPINKDAKEIFKQIKDALKDCDELVIATDVDPSGEGDLLAWEILENVPHARKKITRMYFVDETPKEIQKAFVNRKPVDRFSDPLFKKADYRSKFDFLTMQSTRIATNFTSDGVLRVGRLKGYMVTLVGSQKELISSYQKIPFYERRFKDENGVVYSSKNQQQYKTPEEVPTGFHSSSVIKDKEELKKVAPPKLIDLATLTSYIVPKGFSAKTVEDCYQKMYQDHIVSYPRTEDKTITPEQFNELMPLVPAIAKVVGVKESLLTHRTPRPTHVKPQGSHGANRPGSKVPASLDYLDKTYGAPASIIYNIVSRSFLAILAEDYEYIKHSGHVKDYPDFIGSINVPKFLGFRAVSVSDDIPEMSENAKTLGTIAEPIVHEGFPPKPAEPTMKWLMKQLEKADIGTGATRTSTYAEVTNQKHQSPLMKDTKGRISLTTYGDLAYKLCKGTYIASKAISEDLQRDMKLIAEGKADGDELLSKVKDFIRSDLDITRENAKQNNLTERSSSSSETASDFAKKREQEIQNGERAEITWKGQKRTFKTSFGSHKFTPDEIALLVTGESITIEGTSASGKKFKALGKLKEKTYNGNKYIGFDVEKWL